MTNNTVGVGLMGWWRDRPAMFMVRVALLILVVLAIRY